jgi:hypothetical protein
MIEMAERVIKLPHPDTKDATIEIYWDEREVFASILTKEYDAEGNKYFSDVMLDKSQLGMLIDVLNIAHKEMLDE